MRLFLQNEQCMNGEDNSIQPILPMTYKMTLKIQHPLIRGQLFIFTPKVRLTLLSIRNFHLIKLLVFYLEDDILKTEISISFWEKILKLTI